MDPSKSHICPVDSHNQSRADMNTDLPHGLVTTSNNNMKLPTALSTDLMANVGFAYFMTMEISAVEENQYLCNVSN